MWFYRCIQSEYSFLAVRRIHIDEAVTICYHEILFYMRQSRNGRTTKCNPALNLAIIYWLQRKSAHFIILLFSYLSTYEHESFNSLHLVD